MCMLATDFELLFKEYEFENYFPEFVCNFK